jgi:hypothetical protein
MKIGEMRFGKLKIDETVIGATVNYVIVKE